MRWIVALLLLLAPACSVRGDEITYYVTSRIWDSIPKLGPLHHASVVICDSSIPPVVVDEKGRKMGNPALSYYGSRPGQYGFHVESSVVEASARKIDIPPELVRQRLSEYDGRWSIIHNCQVAAHWAISPAGKWTFYAWILRK